jgi:hypothetical protein
MDEKIYELMVLLLIYIMSINDKCTPLEFTVYQTIQLDYMILFDP